MQNEFLINVACIDGMPLRRSNNIFRQTQTSNSIEYTALTFQDYLIPGISGHSSTYEINFGKKNAWKNARQSLSDTKPRRTLIVEQLQGDHIDQSN